MTPTITLTRAEFEAVKMHIKEAFDCFVAADTEGLNDRLHAEFDLYEGSLHGLITRRLLYAPPALEQALEILDKHEVKDDNA